MKNIKKSGLTKVVLIHIALILITLSSVSSAVDNSSRNYVHNGSEWIPWISTSEGRPKVDLNLLNITAGDVTASGNVTASYFFGDGSQLTGLSGAGRWNLTGSNLYPESLSYNVGIGTSSPSQKLHVKSSADDAQLIVEADGTNKWAGLRLIPTGNQFAYINYGIANATGNDLIFYSSKIGVGAVMRMDNDGNVGIGTDNPLSKLDLAGNFRIAGNITPSAASTWSIGSNLTPFKSAFIDELYVSGDSIYMNDQKVLESQAAEMKFTATADQHMTVQTSGSGLLKLMSENADISLVTSGAGRVFLDSNDDILIQTDQSNKDISITAVGASSDVFLSSTGEIDMTSSNVKVNSNMNVSGNMIADAFIGDGSQLTGISAGHWNVTGSDLYPEDLSYNVGIGTAPSYQFHVITSTAGNWAAQIKNEAATGDGLNLRTGAGDGNQSICKMETFAGGDMFDFLDNGNLFVAGNVGIGTATPTSKLDVAGSLRSTNTVTPTSDQGVEINYDNTDNIGYVFAYDRTGSAYKPLVISGDPLTLREGATVVLTIDGGNVGIGTATPDTNMEVSDSGTNSETVSRISTYNDQEAFGSFLEITKSHSDTQGTKVTTVDTEILGRIDFKGVDSGQNVDLGARIQVTQTGDAGTRCPSDIIFYTSTSTNTPERMRIDSDGKVGIGTASPEYPLSLGADNKIGYYSDATHYAYIELFNVITGDMEIKSDTGGTSHLLLNPEGNVGIGTTTPSQELTVIGEINATTKMHTPELCLDGNCQTSWSNGAGHWNVSGSNLYPESLSYNVGIGTDSPIAELHLINNYEGRGIRIERTSATTGRYDLGITTTGNFYIDETSVAPRIIIQKTTGNVGIGTDSPAITLDIDGMARVKPSTEAPSVGTGSGIELQYHTPTDRGYIYSYDRDVGGGYKNLTLGLPSGQLVLDSGGNVGIGTTSPSGNLHVNQSQGDATEIIVENVNTGNAAGAVFHAIVDGTNTNFKIAAHSSGTTDSGFARPRGASVLADSGMTGGLSLAARNAAGDIRFYTAGITDSEERMRIDHDGNVGIGTSSPAYPLSVASSATNQLLHLNSTPYGSNAVYILFENMGSSSPLSTKVWSQYNNLRLDAGEDTRIFINGTNGNIGIGETNPEQKLHVAGTLRLEGSIESTAPGGGNANDNLDIDFPDAQTSHANVRLFRSTNTTGDKYLAIYKGDATTAIQTNLDAEGNSYINALSGNVGIGTDSPGGKLEIAGPDDGTEGLRVLKGTNVIGKITTLSAAAGEEAGALLLYDNGGTVDVLLSTIGNSYFKGGHVGIGTTTPSHELNVVGDLNVTGTIYSGGSVDLSKPLLRYTKSKVAYDASDPTKDSLCVTEFGSAYEAATPREVVSSSYTFGAYGAGGADQKFNAANYTTESLTNIALEDYRVNSDTGGTYELACIYEFAPIRFTRSEIDYDASDAAKDSLCVTEFGSGYAAATLKEVAALSRSLGMIGFGDYQKFNVANYTTGSLNTVFGSNINRITDTTGGTYELACIRI